MSTKTTLKILRVFKIVMPILGVVIAVDVWFIPMSRLVASANMLLLGIVLGVVCDLGIKHINHTRNQVEE